jgi:hypothetical protein
MSDDIMREMYRSYREIAEQEHIWPTIERVLPDTETIIKTTAQFVPYNTVRIKLNDARRNALVHVQLPPNYDQKCHLTGLKISIRREILEGLVRNPRDADVDPRLLVEIGGVSIWNISIATLSCILKLSAQTQSSTSTDPSLVELDILSLIFVSPDAVVTQAMLEVASVKLHIIYPEDLETTLINGMLVTAIFKPGTVHCQVPIDPDIVNLVLGAHRYPYGFKLITPVHVLRHERYVISSADLERGVVEIRLRELGVLRSTTMIIDAPVEVLSIDLKLQHGENTTNFLSCTITNPVTLTDPLLHSELTLVTLDFSVVPECRHHKEKPHINPGIYATCVDWIIFRVHLRLTGNTKPTTVRLLNTFNTALTSNGGCIGFKWVG